MGARVKKSSWIKLSQETSKVNDVNDLPTDSQVLFNLLSLIVDIKYRNRYGRTLEHLDGRGYSIAMQNEPVDE